MTFFGRIRNTLNTGRHFKTLLDQYTVEENRFNENKIDNMLDIAD